MSEVKEIQVQNRQVAFFKKNKKAILTGAAGIAIGAVTALITKSLLNNDEDDTCDEAIRIGYQNALEDLGCLIDIAETHETSQDFMDAVYGYAENTPTAFKMMWELGEAYTGETAINNVKCMTESATYIALTRALKALEVEKELSDYRF